MPNEAAGGVRHMRERRVGNTNKIAPEVAPVAEMSEEQKDELELARAKIEEAEQKRIVSMIKRRILNFLEDKVGPNSIVQLLFSTTLHLTDVRI